MDKTPSTEVTDVADAEAAEATTKVKATKKASTKKAATETAEAEATESKKKVAKKATKKKAAKKATKKKTTKKKTTKKSALPPEDERPEGRPYSLGETFKAGEWIAHPKFGSGLIQAEIAPTKILVTFDDGDRLLVHRYPVPSS